MAVHTALVSTSGGVARGEWARLEGDDAAHQRELRKAHRFYAEMGATGHVERIAEELAP